MGYRVTGRSDSTYVAGQVVRSFIPFPLPPTAPPVRVAGLVGERFEVAERAVARLALAARVTPDVAPLAKHFSRKECVLSCQISGGRLGLAELLRAEGCGADGRGAGGRVNGGRAADDRDRDLERVRHCVDALAHARAQLTDPHGLPVSVRLFGVIHRRLVPTGVVGESRPGEVRRSPASAGTVQPGYAELLPPPPGALPELLTSLERFIRSDDSLPPLVRAGLVHAQLQTIHPYVDGNGRLARLLVPVLLQHWGVLADPLLYLSLYFKRRLAEYHRRLVAVRVDGDWEGWLTFFLRGVASVADDAIGSIGQLTRLTADDRRRVLDGPDSSLTALRLFELLPGRPVVTTASVMELLGVSKPTAGRCLAALESVGVLVEVTGRKRDRAWVYERYVGRVGLGTEG